MTKQRTMANLSTVQSVAPLRSYVIPFLHNY